MPVHFRKLVVVGDRRVGKTCLISRFLRGEFPETLVPMVWDPSATELFQVDNQEVKLIVWDTICQPCDHYNDRSRPLSYPNTHIILLTFSVDDQASLENIEQLWYPEIRYFLPDVPVILIGCKKDLRNDEHAEKHRHQPVSFDEGLAVALKIGAGQFFECSAKTGDGVAEIFEVAALAAMECQPRRTTGRSCVIL
ncbi:ras-like protein family, member Ab [Flagelloscypha sp. PMI_526]|nr:ras-like protein family, member Ab [Flagelloscypha sp. PMI_526]